MANDDLLQQFKKLLEENNKQQDQNLQNRLDAQDQKFQKRLEENNKQIRKEIRAEVDPLHERMDTQYKNLSGQINAVKTELSDLIIKEAGDLANLIVDHDTQIEELQKAVGLRPKH
jgi:hypothetical protein